MSFKLAIIKLKVHASLWYEHLKKRRLEKPNLKSKVVPSTRSIWT